MHEPRFLPNASGCISTTSTTRGAFSLLRPAPLALLHALVLAAPLPVAAQDTSPPAAFTNVSVIPMDRERVLTNQTVVVRSGRIAAIGPASSVQIPADAVRIEGTGKFLMPGLVDMHAHLARTGGASDDMENRNTLVVFLANGITTLRNMAGTPAILALRREINAGLLPGPRIFTTGPMIGDARGTTRQVTTVAVAESLVVADKAAGYDAIKVVGLTPEIYEAILATARREGIEVYGHVPPQVGFDRATRGGLRSAEHVIPFALALAPAGAKGYTPRSADWTLLPPLATKLRDANTWVCPTLTAAQAFTRDEKLQRLASPSTQYVPKRLRDAWAADVDAAPTAFAADLLAFGLSLTARLRDSGVGLLLGPDANPFLVPGVSLHEELALFVRAGLSPFEALRAGTSDAARFLHQEAEFGTVGVGMSADLLLLEANPLDNVANATKRAGGMVRGRWFAEAELQSRLRSVASAFAK